MLNNFWASLSPPACKSDVLNKWSACVYQIKNKQCLFIGKSIERFLHDENGPIAALSIDCLKPPIGSGNILESIPSHLPHDIGVSISRYILWANRGITNEEWQMEYSRIVKNKRCF